MAGRSDYSQAWMKLSYSFYLDARMLRVSVHARYLFTCMLALTAQTRSSGRIHESQLPMISAGVRNPEKCIQDLVDVGLLTAAPTSHEVDTNSPSLSQKRSKFVAGASKIGPNSDEVPTFWDINGYTKWYGEQQSESDQQKFGDVSAGQEPASRERARERPRERGKKEREKEEELRSYGTERNSSARAAPLAGGAATRPAQKIDDIRAPWDPPETENETTASSDATKPGTDGRFGDGPAPGPSAANRALLAEAIAKGYKGNGSKGAPAKLWKYPRELHSYNPDEDAIPMSRAEREKNRHPDSDMKPVLQELVEQLRARGMSDKDMGLDIPPPVFEPPWEADKPDDNSDSGTE